MLLCILFVDVAWAAAAAVAHKTEGTVGMVMVATVSGKTTDDCH